MFEAPGAGASARECTLGQWTLGQWPWECPNDNTRQARLGYASDVKGRVVQHHGGFHEPFER